VCEQTTGRTALEYQWPRVPAGRYALGSLTGQGTLAHVSMPSARLRLAREGGDDAYELTVHIPGNAVQLRLRAPSSEVPALVGGAMSRGQPGSARPSGLMRLSALAVRGSVRFRSEISYLDGNGGFLARGEVGSP
jgi:hypothetical protein